MSVRHDRTPLDNDSCRTTAKPLVARWLLLTISLFVGLCKNNESLLLCVPIDDIFRPQGRIVGSAPGYFQSSVYGYA